MHSVLLIEDNPGDARLIEEMIREDPGAPFRLVYVDRLSRALEHLADGETALVLLDLSLPDSIGLETFSRVYSHSPAVPIIAEGVETDAQLRFLRRHDCDEVQGFFYGEAVPPEAHARLLLKARRKAGR
jgi:CheY-like chemotaxis protein